MALLFQYFVFNFLRFEQGDLAVYRETIKWSAQSDRAPRFRSCPKCEQIFPFRTTRKLVIDIKYYQGTIQEYYDSRNYIAKISFNCSAI